MDGCLFAYANDEWQVLEDKLRALPLTNKDARAFARFMLAGAAQVEIDKQGRILLPQVLRTFAGLDKDVVLLGIASRIEIWNRDKWEAAALEADGEELAEKMENLGI